MGPLKNNEIKSTESSKSSPIPFTETKKGEISGRQVSPIQDKNKEEATLSQAGKIPQLQSQSLWDWAISKLGRKADVGTQTVPQKSIDEQLDKTAVLLGEKVPENVETLLREKLKDLNIYTSYKNFLDVCHDIREENFKVLKANEEILGKNLKELTTIKDEELLPLFSIDEFPILDLFVAQKVLQRLAPDNTQLFADSFRTLMYEPEEIKKKSSVDSRRIGAIESARKNIDTMGPLEKQLVNLNYFQFKTSWWKADLDKSTMISKPVADPDGKVLNRIATKGEFNCGIAIPGKELCEAKIVFDISPIVDINELNLEQCEQIYDFLKECVDAGLSERIPEFLSKRISGILAECVVPSQTQVDRKEQLVHIQDFLKAIKGKDPSEIQQMFNQFQEEWKPFQANLEEILKNRPFLEHAEQLADYGTQFRLQVRQQVSKMMMAYGDPHVSLPGLVRKFYNEETGNYENLAEIALLQTEFLLGKTKGINYSAILEPFLKNNEFVRSYNQFLETCNKAKKINKEQHETATRQDPHNLAIAQSSIPLLEVVQQLGTSEEQIEFYSLIKALKDNSLPALR